VTWDSWNHKLIKPFRAEDFNVAEKKWALFEVTLFSRPENLEEASSTLWFSHLLAKHPRLGNGCTTIASSPRLFVGKCKASASEVATQNECK